MVPQEGGSSNPQAGDTLDVITIKPFTRQDILEFEFLADNLARVDADSASRALDDVFVYPNPYIGTHAFEPAPTQARPQQERVLYFTNLPARCTLRIFTISGFLVNEIDINNSIDNGTYQWNMRTKDNLEIAYGIYYYHVDAGDVGETTGKFAVIK